MTIKDFRRIALSFERAEESSHMGAADFRVGGKIFCTLAHAKKGYGNLMLTPEQQQMFVQDLPDVFIPVAGGWGRNGATHCVLANASEDVLEGALRVAYKRRVGGNAKTARPKSAVRKTKPASKLRPKKNGSTSETPRRSRGPNR